MKTSDFSWGDKIIDSRDIIARYEELTDDYNNLVELVEDAKENYDAFIKENGVTGYSENDVRYLHELREEVEGAKSVLAMFNTEHDDELKILQNVISQGEDSPNWSYGETLIHEDYFVEYTEEFVNDCWELPKEMNEGLWPWCHMNMDWDSAAEELKNEYFTIEADGETYYIRA